MRKKNSLIKFISRFRNPLSLLPPPQLFDKIARLDEEEEEEEEDEEEEELDEDLSDETGELCFMNLNCA